ncbi:sarcosine oxidase subunit gamma family protein [uncultured Ruegeria sp.]|uniref:sarcosine oxidase subunit gamma family protein n=1 Tax=uncultured Ruegeria sp. TaxID=259304 RepID=UPI00260BA414|nr:sarcosine oxidase subunit gamma family protein [uncultured Ruegeria sp.]
MSYDVTFQRCGISALFDLKGAVDAVEAWVGDALPDFPDRPNYRTGKDGKELFFIGRDHWLARAPLEQEVALEARLKPTDCPVDISIVRVSDTTTFFRVTGPDAGEILAIACPLDLHDSMFDAEAVTYTEVFGLKALVMRCKDGIEFGVEQSFADMIEEYLSRATA